MIKIMILHVFRKKSAARLGFFFVTRCAENRFFPAHRVTKKNFILAAAYIHPLSVKKKSAKSD